MTRDTPTKNEHAPAADNDRLAELFHELTQPLTTLHCCLELSLKKVPRSSKSRKDLQIALQQVEQIAKLIAQIREHVETGNGNNQCVQEALREPALPLAWPSRCCG